ncbi:MAG TPA: hypothetical protein VN838_20800 [Bradyrhizobium sp.]|nr:hypothetical protein [Bradyrhizobium sp.]
MSEARYDAFISYRRSDGAGVAHWLRRALQGFRAPAWLQTRFNRRLNVYLDTAYERGASDFYEQNIKPALLASRYLLVVATPGAVRRADGFDDWMLREVSDFSHGPNGGNVIAVRAAGEFDDPLPADLARRFPNIEIVDLRGASRFSFLNPVRTAKLSAEKLKIVAPLVDLAHDEMPLLRQEEEKRQQARLGTAAGITLGVLVAISLLSIFALQSRFRATRALESSMFATGRMVLSVAGQLDRGGDDDALRRRLLNEACDLIDKLRVEADRDARIGELVTCEVERGYQHERNNEPDLAKAAFQEATDRASARHRATGGVDAALGVVEARKEMAAYLLRRKDADAADAELARLLDDARRFGKAHDQRREFAEAEGEALGRRGDIRLSRGDRTAAGESYDAAAEAVERAVVSLSGKPAPSRIEWLARLYRLAGEQFRALGDRDGALGRLARAGDVRAKIEAASMTPGIELETAIAAAFASDLQRQRGDAEAAAKARMQADAGIERVTASKDASESQKQRAQGVQAWLRQQFAGGSGSK